MSTLKTLCILKNLKEGETYVMFRCVMDQVSYMRTIRVEKVETRPSELGLTKACTFIHFHNVTMDTHGIQTLSSFTSTFRDKRIEVLDDILSSLSDEENLQVFEETLKGTVNSHMRIWFKKEGLIWR